ncbi:MAG: hypothetical protein FJ360_00690 [Thaumarchaeota archaeon]|nr:hypothetical protein [Nitrososphaerota archaeon]
MTSRSAIFTVLLSAILIVGTISPALAAQLEIRMNPEADFATGDMKYQKTVFIEYNDGGKIADQLRGKEFSIVFTADATNPGVAKLRDQLNQNIASKGSGTHITDLVVEYSAHLTGRPLSTSIDYKVVLKPTINDYVIRPFSTNSPALVDISWRGLAVSGPFAVNTPQYGDVEINMPKSFIKSIIPDTYSVIAGTQAETLLSKSIIDASFIGEQPFSNWHFLFDPTGINVDASTYGLDESISGFVVSTFTMGESSFREGIQIEREESAQFTADKTYTVRTVQSADNANLKVIGFAAVDRLEGEEVLGVSPQAPQGYATTSTGGFPVSIIYGMAAMAGIGAIAIFFISSRQLKKEEGKGQQGIDPSQLRGYSTSSASGGYQTNRGEAQLISDAEYDKHRSVYETEKPASGGNKGGAMPKDWKPSS